LRRSPPQDAPAGLIQMHRRLLVSQIAEQNETAAIDKQAEASQLTIKASIEKLKAIIPPLEERVEIRSIWSEGAGVQVIYLSDRTDRPAAGGPRAEPAHRGGGGDRRPDRDARQDRCRERPAC
jgi:hypothetical protein